MPTTTTRLGIDVVAGTDLVASYPTTNAQQMGILDSAVTFFSGTLSARSGVTHLRGQVYYATDTALFYWDTGSAWETAIVAGAWTNLTMSASFTSHNAQARVEGNVVRLRGAVENATGSSASAVTIATGSGLPGGFASGNNLTTSIINWTTGSYVATVTLFVNAGNSIAMTSGSPALANGQSISLDGLTYPLS